MTHVKPSAIRFRSVHAAPYLWSGGIGSHPLTVSYGYASDMLPWLAPSFASQQSSSPSKQRPALHDIQQAFEHARQQPPQHVDAEFSHVTMDSLRAEMQQAIDNSAAHEGSPGNAQVEFGQEAQAAVTAQVLIG